MPYTYQPSSAALVSAASLGVCLGLERLAAACDGCSGARAGASAPAAAGLLEACVRRTAVPDPPLGSPGLPFPADVQAPRLVWAVSSSRSVIASARTERTLSR